MLYLAFFYVYAYIACPHKHTGGFIIIINSKYFSFSDWPANPPTNASSSAYRNNLKDVAKI